MIRPTYNSNREIEVTTDWLKDDSKEREISEKDFNEYGQLLTRKNTL